MNRATTLILTLAMLAPIALAANTPTLLQPEEPQFVRAIMKLDDGADQTTVVVPAALPTPAATSGIGPGSHLFMKMVGDSSTYACTANWLWTAGGKTYLGAAGHCFVPEGKTATHGPGADWDPTKTTVRVCISSCNFGGELGFFFGGTTVALGQVAYARQTQGGEDLGNDFGIVEVPAALASYLRPEMPVWGGVDGVQNMSIGSVVCIYGNGVAVGEFWPTMARAGSGLSTSSGTGAWRANIASAPGDSGSAIARCESDGTELHATKAAGLLTHLVIGGVGFVAGTSMAKAQTMANQAGLSITPVFA